MTSCLSTLLNVQEICYLAHQLSRKTCEGKGIPSESTTSVMITQTISSHSLVASSPGLLIGGRGERERRPGIHCMRMRYVFHVFYRKSVRKCIQTVSVCNRIIQNLNNNGACARSGYQAFVPPPPNQKAWGRG